MTKIFQNIKLFTSMSVFALSFSAKAEREMEIVEIPLKNVFSPAVGFDDNDMIQVVVDGELPNVCYSQGRTDVHVDSDKKEIVVMQLANVQHTGVCADLEKLPEEFRTPVPFTTEVNIGQLSKGSYKVSFKSQAGRVERSVDVAAAPTSTVDSLRYATVLNAFVDDFVPESRDQIEIRLTVQLNSSCTALSDSAQVIKQDDVLIVLPEVVSKDVFCLPVSRLFYKIYSVPNPGRGRYLLHVRSLGGNAKNKIFSVVEGTGPNSRR